MKISLLCVLLLLCAVAVNCTDPEKGKIEGLVTEVDDYRIVISGASLRTEPATGVVTTGNTGQYTLENLAPGKYDVIAAKAGYEDSRVTVNVLKDKKAVGSIKMKRR